MQIVLRKEWHKYLQAKILMLRCGGGTKEIKQIKVADIPGWNIG